MMWQLESRGDYFPTTTATTTTTATEQNDSAMESRDYFSVEFALQQQQVWLLRTGFKTHIDQIGAVPPCLVSAALLLAP